MARGARKARDDLDELSRLFLELRERADLTQPEAASRAGITQSMLSRAETGRGVPNSETTNALARLYAATSEERRRLLELVAVMKPARMDSRLIMQRGKNLRFQERVRDIEQSCALVRAYQPHMVLGAAQTPAYALEVFTANAARPSTPTSADTPAELAVARAARYQQLADEKQRTWILIMSEAALNWLAGSASVMAEQMDRLIEASKLPHVRLGIIPFRTPARVFAPHGFDLYDSRGVCIGTKTATALSTDPHDIADYEALFGELERMAIFDDEVRALLRATADSYRGM